MPIHKIEISGKESGWALWHITESEEALCTMANPDTCPTDIHSPAKRLEWLTGRILLRKLLDKAGLPFHGLTKDSFGKPFLEGHSHHSISLSHSYPYVAIQLDSRTSVGIDVEQPKEKLLHIAGRVLSKGEWKDAGTDIVKNCIYWCAKEVLYKIYGKKSVSFAQHLHIDPFQLAQQGTLTGKISVTGVDQLATLEYSVEKEYVIVRTKSA